MSDRNLLDNKDWKERRKIIFKNKKRKSEFNIKLSELATDNDKIKQGLKHMVWLGILEETMDKKFIETPQGKVIREMLVKERKQGAVEELEKIVNELRGLEVIVDAELKYSNSFYAINSLRIGKQKRLLVLRGGQK